MAKRFTDSNKWQDEWFSNLDNDLRIVWLYLVDVCTIAGRWKKNFKNLNFYCNTRLTEETFKDVFGSRTVDRGKYFFIPKFIVFQNPKGLTSKKPAVLSIVKELKEYGLFELAQNAYQNESLNNPPPTNAQPLNNRFETIIGKGTGKGEGKGIGIGKGKGVGKGGGAGGGNHAAPEPEPIAAEVEAQARADPQPEIFAPVKSEIFAAIFHDDDFVTELVRMYPMRNLQQAFEECWIYHATGPNPPREVWLWKQKLTTWLTGKESKQAYGNIARKNQATNDRRETIAKHYGAKPNGGEI